MLSRRTTLLLGTAALAVRRLHRGRGLCYAKLEAEAPPVVPEHGRRGRGVRARGRCGRVSEAAREGLHLVEHRAGRRKARAEHLEVGRLQDRGGRGRRRAEASALLERLPPPHARARRARGQGRTFPRAPPAPVQRRAPQQRGRSRSPSRLPARLRGATRLSPRAQGSSHRCVASRRRRCGTARRATWPCGR